MNPVTKSRLPEILQKHDSNLLQDWLRELKASGSDRSDLIGGSELREQCATFLKLMSQSAASGNLDTVGSSGWAPVRDLLTNISRSRAVQGFTPTQTASFVFALKRPLSLTLRQELGANPEALFDEMWTATGLLDQLGLYTTEVYQKAREEVIGRQQEELLELSTPVVKLWDGVLALPMIGTLDSARTQVVMESLLQKIVETGSEIAIIDITGVPTVDTLTAQHLLKTVAAARLMGADCIISGIRPQIAQTIVHLAIDLKDITTKATLADALVVALQRVGRSVVSVEPRG